MSDENIIPIDIRRRPNFEIVMRAMRDGQEITLPDGHTYTWIDDRVCLRMEVWKGTYTSGTDPDEIQYSVSDMPINYFIEQCEKMSEEDIMSITFSSVMRSMVKDRRG